MSIRVGIADSGINPNFKLAQPVEAGVGFRVQADVAQADDRWQDELGHGTAVAATVRSYAAAARLFPIRIFRKRLVAPVTALIAAIDWAAENRMHLLNLSLGVSKLQWRETFELAVARALAAEVLLVSTADVDGAPCLPGCLPGVLAVRGDSDLKEGEFTRDGDVVLASTWASKLPLLPREKNLSGSSLAVAHVTGFLAQRFDELGPTDAAGSLELFE